MKIVLAFTVADENNGHACNKNQEKMKLKIALRREMEIPKCARDKINPALCMSEIRLK